MRRWVPPHTLRPQRRHPLLRGHHVRAARFSLLIRDDAGHRALRSLGRCRIALAYLHSHLDVEGDLAAALTMRRFLPDVHPSAFLARWAPAVLRGRP